MIHNYPSLDSSDHKSKDINNPGYEYNEPPRTSLEINQPNLNEPLIDSTPVVTSDPNTKTFILISILAMIEFGCFYYIVKFATLFEFCFWEFKLKEFAHSQFYPLYSRYSGQITTFIKEIGCNQADFDRCPGMCDAIKKYSSVTNYFIWACILKYFTYCLSISWIVYESKKKNYNKARKIFALFQTISCISLISIFAYVLLYPDFDNLQDPVDRNDGAVPVGFEWKLGFYMIIFLAVYMPLTSLLVYLKLKSTN